MVVDVTIRIPGGDEAQLTKFFVLQNSEERDQVQVSELLPHYDCVIELLIVISLRSLSGRTLSHTFFIFSRISLF